MSRQSNHRNRLLATIVCLLVLPSLAAPFIQQSDVLTVFLDEEIKTFGSFTRDKLHYRLSMNEKYHYFDFTFLNYSHSPRSVQQNSQVIDIYEIGESKGDITPMVKVYYTWNGAKNSLGYRKTELDGTSNSLSLGDEDVVDKVAVKFMEDSGGIGTLVYAAQRNDNANKTIWRIHCGIAKNSNLIKNEHQWKISSSVQNNFGVRIIPKNSWEFFFLYYDLFDKKTYTDDNRFVNFFETKLPQLGYYPMLSIKPNEGTLFAQIPIFCAPDYAGNMKNRLYDIMVDAAHVNIEGDRSSFFFLMENQFDQNQAVCLMPSNNLSWATEYNSEPSDFRCDKELGRCIPSKRLPLNKMLLQFKKSLYERILVKQMSNSTNESIIFLLEKGKQQLQIFDLFEALAEDGTNRLKVCFEGIYKLRSQMETILDIRLEANSLLVITGNYIQRIPIGSFCTPHSFSSCQSVSTCTLDRATCNHPKHSKRGCLSLDEINTSKMSSEQYMCERESKDVCLVGRIEPQTKSNYEKKICGENSCRCQSELCIPGTACTDDARLTYCFLSRTKMKLSSFSIAQPYEPLATMMVSAFITLLAIAFILITFYCCFSMTQSSKKKTAVSDLSTIELSKVDVKGIGS